MYNLAIKQQEMIKAMKAEKKGMMMSMQNFMVDNPEPEVAEVPDEYPRAESGPIETVPKLDEEEGRKLTYS